MNKIEKAISDFKLRLENMQVERVMLNSNIDLLEDNLNTLECIERDKSIPHEVNFLPIEDYTSGFIKGGGNTTTANNIKPKHLNK